MLWFLTVFICSYLLQPFWILTNHFFWLSNGYYWNLDRGPNPKSVAQLQFGVTFSFSWPTVVFGVRGEIASTVSSYIGNTNIYRLKCKKKRKNNFAHLPLPHRHPNAFFFFPIFRRHNLHQSSDYWVKTLGNISVSLLDWEQEQH